MEPMFHMIIIVVIVGVDLMPPIDQCSDVYRRRHSRNIS